MIGWRSTETVPQAQRVLVCRPTSYPMIATWTDRGWVKDDGRGFPLADHQPTHWMPLPQPPSNDEAQTVASQHDLYDQTDGASSSENSA